MPKIRVHELAKELNVSNKEIINKMEEYGKSVSNHMSSLEDADVSRLKSEMKRQAEKPALERNTENPPPRPRPVGEDGKPLRPRPLGPDGKPLPPRPRPLGPDGKPLPPRPRPLGPDGKPLPPRPRPLGPDGKPLPPRPRPLGPDGKPLPPRPRPLGEDGKPLPPRPRPLGPDGKPLPPRPRVASSAPATQSSDVAGVAKTATHSTASTERPHIGSREGRPPRDGNRPQGQGGFGNRQGRSDSRPPRDGNRPQGQGGFGNRPGGAGGGRPQGGFGGNRPAGQGGFGNRPQGGRPGGASGGRPGGFGGGRKDDKKPEPARDNTRNIWTRNQFESSAKKDKKDTGRKENQQGFERRSTKSRPPKRVMPVRPQPTVSLITVAPEITVRDLAEKLLRSNADIIKVLMKKGVMVTANQAIDFETASYVAETFDVLVEEYVEVDVFEEAFENTPDDESSLLSRPPVVVVMGHVDHGKTSLLDVIRNASVQQSEAGGITQHIGAYSVKLRDNDNKRITFLDTPGHEAFTAMRMRGAQVTDIAILVVAADDGVMPQTIEAINHAKAAGVELIVAITMMDKPNANPDKVKQQLATHDLQSEDWGGSTITVPVSAREKIGIEQLLEMILLVAEMKELKANPNKPARGSIIEAKLDKGRGPVATVLVQEGTLKVGDPVVAGACFGKVRAMVDSRGRNVKEAGPSMPVEIIGLAEVPVTGDILYAAVSDKQARQLSETVVAKGRENMIKSTQGKVSLDDLFSQIQAGQVKDLNIVVKADVQGSVEALRGSLEKLTNDEVRVRIIHTGVGAVTESDVMLASASNAIIIGFNVRPEPVAKSVAESENVDVRMYSVIYSAIDDIEAAMKGMLDPEFEEKILGQAEIREIFKASGIGTIGGCYVTEGKITRNAQVRLVRDGRVIYDGHLETLKRFKDDVREVNHGYECGMLFKNYNDIKEGDKVEAYVMEEIPR
ncbi:MAG: translation initiation factor IF-2 [Defluviitaleaceae bacterium]|nr:translation initiation factor IF-2 [Defluviitaleaceae bacterium]